jgi:hypothetical protein
VGDSHGARGPRAEDGMTDPRKTPDDPAFALNTPRSGTPVAKPGTGSSAAAANAAAATAWSGESTVRDFASLAGGERLSVALAAGPWIVARRLAPDEAPPLSAVVFAGTLSRMAVPDILSIAHAAGIEGELTFVLPDATKRVFMHGGSIVFATSTLVDDRLGEHLLSRGRLPRREFEAASHECTSSGKKLGRVLVERGLLSTADLFLAIREQIESIVLSLFTYSMGTVVFSGGPLSITNPVRLPNSIEHYVLEGVRRSDELKQPLEEVSDRLAVFKPSGRAGLTIADGRPGMERDVAALVDGVSAVWEVLARSAWSQANTLLALARLLRAGVIARVAAEESAAGARSPASRDVSGEGAAALVERVNAFLREASRALSASGGAPRAASAFLESVKPAHRALFARVRFGDDGALDAAVIAANFRGVPGSPAEASRLLRDALQDMVEFVLWVASDQVPEIERARLALAASDLRKGAAS